MTVQEPMYGRLSAKKSGSCREVAVGVEVRLNFNRTVVSVSFIQKDWIMTYVNAIAGLAVL